MDIHKNVRDTRPEDVAAAHQEDVKTQEAYGVKYLRWWFNRDLGSIYCLVDAPSADAAIEVHRKAHGLLPDEIIQLEPGDAESFIGPDEHGPAVREDPIGRINTDTAFRTIVFTDLEDSTPLNERLGDDAYVELLKAHDELMAECLRSHDGRQVKHTGDGLMAAFASVAKAVQCMIEMQQALARYSKSRTDLALRARMGSAAGEPVEHNQDLFGATVTLAARLRDHASAGQILVAGVVRDLCMGKGFRFENMGDIRIKGFDEPTRVYEVRWD
jgi:class 3 adenylate cyclase